MAFSQHVNYRDTHRLIPTLFSDESVLETLDLPALVIANLSELDAATDERIQAQRGQSLTIGLGETLQGVPEYRIVNSAFAYAGSGSRFSDSRRGAWYAGTEINTSIAEVVFHKRRFLQDSRFTNQADYEYRDFLADFAGMFSHLDEKEKASCLEPEPVPQCYDPGQALATTLLYEASNGLVYPSVRKPGGTCIVCFRPAMVNFPRRGHRYRLKIGAGIAWSVDEVEQMD